MESGFCIVSVQFMRKMLYRDGLFCMEIYLDDSFPIQDIFCYKIKKGGKNASDKIGERNDNLI